MHVLSACCAGLEKTISHVRLSGVNREDGYAVYKIREIAFGGGTKLSAEDGFLQFMMERLFASNAPTEESDEDEEQEEDGDEHEADQPAEYHRFYELCRTHLAG